MLCTFSHRDLSICRGIEIFLSGKAAKCFTPAVSVGALPVIFFRTTHLYLPFSHSPKFRRRNDGPHPNPVPGPSNQRRALPRPTARGCLGSGCPSSAKTRPGRPDGLIPGGRKMSQATGWIGSGFFRLEPVQAGKVWPGSGCNRYVSQARRDQDGIFLWIVRRA
jgi:hypothetical protein